MSLSFVECVQLYTVHEGHPGYFFFVDCRCVRLKKSCWFICLHIETSCDASYVSFTPALTQSFITRQTKGFVKWLIHYICQISTSYSAKNDSGKSPKNSGWGVKVLTCFKFCLKKPVFGLKKSSFLPKIHLLSPKCKFVWGWDVKSPVFSSERFRRFSPFPDPFWLFFN